MATPQSPDQMAAMVDNIAAKQMGVAPEQQAPAKEEPKTDTAQDKAADKGSPQTEGDKAQEPAIVYDVAFGDQTRQLTPQQIASTFERYSALNHKQAQYKPVLDLVDQYMRNTGTNPKQFAKQLSALQKAAQANPQMGNTEGDKSGPPYPKSQKSSDLDTNLRKWEEDNAASLPPGYRDMVVGQQQGMAQMQQQLAQTQKMLQQVLAQSQGMTAAAKEGMAGATNKQAQAIKQQIANNIDRSQQALKLPDDKAQDFMTFAAERGYTMEDFADIQLTYKVMQDFRNNMDSPEMERMRQIAQRRQAFTGSLGSTPNASPAPEAGAEGPSRFDEFASAQMAKRGLG